MPEVKDQERPFEEFTPWISAPGHSFISISETEWDEIRDLRENPPPLTPNAAEANRLWLEILKSLSVTGVSGSPPLEHQPPADY
jgi:hypothetical protein